MATQHNFRIKNGLEVAGVQRISSAGVITGTLDSNTTATTQSALDNSTKIATTAYTDAAITALIDSSPSTLNTLNELAAALDDDANFSTTITNSIATKLPLTGGTLTGALTMNVSPTVNNARLLVQRANDDSSIAFANNASGTPSSNTWAMGYDHSASNGFAIAYSASGIPSLTGNNLIQIDTGGDVTLSNGELNVSNYGIKLNQDFGSGVPTMTMLGTAANGRAGAIHFKEQGDVDTAAIYSTDGTASGNANYGGLTVATYQSDIRFSTGGLANTKMIIKENGNVGIGTGSTASKKLHITGNDNQLVIDGNSAAANSGLFFAEQGADKWEVYHRGADNTFRIYNYATSSPTLTITNTGSVGINSVATAGHSFEVHDKSDGYSMMWTGRSSSGEGRGITTHYGLLGVDGINYDGDGAYYPTAGFSAAADNSSGEQVDFWFGSSTSEWRPMVFFCIGAHTSGGLTGQTAGWALIRATHYNNGVSFSILDSGGGGTWTTSVQGNIGDDRSDVSRCRIQYSSTQNRTVLSVWGANYSAFYGASRA